MVGWSESNMKNTAREVTDLIWGHVPALLWRAEENNENFKLKTAGMTAVLLNLEPLEYETGVPTSCTRCSLRPMG
jgi:hypothetical protein